MDLRERVSTQNEKTRKKDDEPWGTSLAIVLKADAPDLYETLVKEGLDPTGFHSGSERYAQAWARVG